MMFVLVYFRALKRNPVKCLNDSACPYIWRSPALSLACSISTWKRKGNGCYAGQAEKILAHTVPRVLSLLSQSRERTLGTRLQWFQESPKMVEDPELQHFMCFSIVSRGGFSGKICFFLWTVEFPNAFIVISTT